MAKEYKPERPVTSEKIKSLIQERFERTYKTPNNLTITNAGDWKRIFRKGLPKSRSQMRGFAGYVRGVKGSGWLAAIAISDDKDSILARVYILEGGAMASEAEAAAAVKEEAKKLAVLEVMFSDD